MSAGERFVHVATRATLALQLDFGVFWGPLLLHAQGFWPIGNMKCSVSVLLQPPGAHAILLSSQPLGAHTILLSSPAHSGPVEVAANAPSACQAGAA